MSLTPSERSARVKESDDLCAIWGRAEGEDHRYFVRCVLKVPLLDAPDETGWGIWADVGEVDFRRIVDTWSDPDQVSLPPMEAVLANRVPDYPETTWNDGRAADEQRVSMGGG